MNGIGRKILHRLRSDRGSMGFVMVMVLFFACGMLVMTWNTYTLSRDKMMCQAAADAAALEHALWQARGMNLIQDINTEIYDTCELTQDIYTVAVIIGGAAMIIEPLFPPISEAIAAPIKILGQVVMYAGRYIQSFILPFEQALRHVYRFTPVIGYLSAQQAAKYNGADPLFVKKWDFDIFGQNIDLSPYAIGIAGTTAIFMLPLEKKEAKDDLKGRWYLFQGPGLIVFGYLGWGNPKWDDVPYYATKENVKTFIPATLWLCLKHSPPEGWISAFDNWFGIDSDSKIPLFAYSCAKAYSGDVVMLSERKESYRPARYGTGANAVLVSLNTVADDFDKKADTVKQILSFGFYH